MTPPQAPATEAGSKPQAALLCLERLRRRADFLTLGRARRQAMPGMLVQGRERGDHAAAMRVGFTCSKKLGNAVARNRARRRLRAVARLVLPEHGRPGWDYALIGRSDATAGRDFEVLKNDLVEALARLHGAP